MPRNQFMNHDEDDKDPEEAFEDAINKFKEEEPLKVLSRKASEVLTEDLGGLFAPKDDRVVDAIQRRHQNMLNMLESDRKRSMEKDPE